MDIKQLTFDAALALVRRQRPIVNINQGFLDQLKAHEPKRIGSMSRGRGKILAVPVLRL
jgi:hypothetical protein